MRTALIGPGGLHRHALAGAVNALTSLVAMLSLGIVAMGSLGPVALQLGMNLGKLTITCTSTVWIP